MKKLITSALFAFILISAQGAGLDEQVKTKAADMARRMANQIELNESEYIQVKTYLTEKLASEVMIRDMYSNDVEMMFRKLTEADNACNQKIESLLNTKQLENYLAIQKSLKAELPVIATSGE
ncbi:hypothetical protein [Adhaeribacter soli]|uniref:Uncharacterized protein n=1 Tax=Adhaeribacter soli TaxID=2607655 RepID=A0A5N1J5C5_9BACT|nr:hypothetical protein [Adhaeribacter soli]KAA9345927.1 hypothetical protein F0P94_02260 [Adhaeribacter soli]